MSYSEAFLRADAFVARVEGGLSDHPADHGGSTAFGISRASHPQEEPWPPSAERAQYLRWKGYWHASLCEDLPGLVALVTYDWAINSGKGRPARALQTELVARGAQILVDGDIGPATALAALQVCQTPELDRDVARAMLQARCRRFVEIVRGDASQLAFLGGWWERTRLLADAISDGYLSELDLRPDPGE